MIFQCGDLNRFISCFSDQGLGQGGKSMCLSVQQHRCKCVFNRHYNEIRIAHLSKHMFRCWEGPSCTSDQPSHFTPGKGIVETWNDTSGSTHLQTGLISGRTAQPSLQDTTCSSDFLPNSSLCPPRRKTSTHHVERGMVACSSVLGEKLFNGRGCHAGGNTPAGPPLVMVQTLLWLPERFVDTPEITPYVGKTYTTYLTRNAGKIQDQPLEVWILHWKSCTHLRLLTVEHCRCFGTRLPDVGEIW